MKQDTIMTNVEAKPKKKTVDKAEIISRNSHKPVWNLSRISKYMHILIFEYLTPKELFCLSGVCRNLLKASKDNGVWEKHFPNERRLREYIAKYKG